MCIFRFMDQNQAHVSGRGATAEVDLNHAIDVLRIKWLVNVAKSTKITYDRTVCKFEGSSTQMVVVKNWYPTGTLVNGAKD